MFGGGQAGDDPLRGGHVERGRGVVDVVGQRAIDQGGLDREAEEVHGDVDEDGAGTSRLRNDEGPVQDLGEKLGTLNPERPFHEWPVDLPLVGVGVMVHLLVGVFAEVVSGYVTCDHDHRYGIQGGVGHPGGGVGQARPEVGQHHRGAVGHPGVAVGGVGRDLFVADVDELDSFAPGESLQHRDDGVTTSVGSLVRVTVRSRRGGPS